MNDISLEPFDYYNKDDQMLRNLPHEVYFLTRARCDICRSKTWFYVHKVEMEILGMREPQTAYSSQCIEHSFADTTDLVKAGYTREDIGIKIRIDPEQTERFTDWAMKLEDKVKQSHEETKRLTEWATFKNRPIHTDKSPSEEYNSPYDV